jgi:hypothetical protein
MKNKRVPGFNLGKLLERRRGQKDARFSWWFHNKLKIVMFCQLNQNDINFDQFDARF